MSGRNTTSVRTNNQVLIPGPWVADGPRPDNRGWVPDFSLGGTPYPWGYRPRLPDRPPVSHDRDALSTPGQNEPIRNPLRLGENAGLHSPATSTGSATPSAIQQWPPELSDLERNG